MMTGKEALIALANGEEVQGNIGSEWVDITVDQKLSIKSFITETNDYGSAVKFRLKPRTITINGIEVPAPFEPKCMEDFYVIDGTHSQGWINGNPANPCPSMGNTKWRTKEEVKQVVAALRSIFK